MHLVRYRGSFLNLPDRAIEIVSGSGTRADFHRRDQDNTIRLNCFPRSFLVSHLGNLCQMSIAKLVLEDGTVFTGRAFGAHGSVDGEVVFNTSMTGYQEILTDPSYNGQIVAMTYPQIGNYGINPQDFESRKPWVRGFVVRELSLTVSNYRANQSLSEFLQAHGIPGIEGIDTRALVRQTRIQGAMRGVLSSLELDDSELIEQARSCPGLIGRDLATEVMPERAYSWEPGFESELQRDPREHRVSLSGTRPHVVALDFGMKWNIPRHLVESGWRVTVLPGSSTAAEVLDQKPDGIFVSNGPGDPAALGGAISMLRTLISEAAEAQGVPLFGICLGHQLLGLALGASTYKLKFGHRGANHPVRDQRTGRVEITTQNHGFAVDPSSLPDDSQVTHVNLNDGTVEGFQHRKLPVFAVQYHPEASAGPHDSAYLFREFWDMLPRQCGV